MTIILGASRPRNFKMGAEAIMWWEETPASHVYCVFQLVTGKNIVFQARGSGTQFLGLESFLSSNIPIYEKAVEVSDADFTPLVSKLIDRLGVKYSLPHLIGLFYKRLIQYVFKKIVANPFKDKNKSEVCVEALCYVIDEAKIKRQAEDPEDMGMFEALQMLKAIDGNELPLG